jgi:N-acetylglucosamine-6-phosphate deacetylase
MGTGIGDGTYRLGDDEVRIEGQVSKRVLDGTLAGACVPLLGAMDNLRRFSSLSESEAVACCTVNAARSVGLMDRGLIQPGKRGDVVVIDPQKQIAMTIIRGRVVHDPRGLVLTADGEPARDPVPAS